MTSTDEHGVVHLSYETNVVEVDLPRVMVDRQGGIDTTTDQPLGLPGDWIRTAREFPRFRGFCMAQLWTADDPGAAPTCLECLKINDTIDQVVQSRKDWSP